MGRTDEVRRQEFLLWLESNEPGEFTYTEDTEITRDKISIGTGDKEEHELVIRAGKEWAMSARKVGKSGMVSPLGTLKWKEKAKEGDLSKVSIIIIQETHFEMSKMY